MKNRTLFSDRPVAHARSGGQRRDGCRDDCGKNLPEAQPEVGVELYYHSSKDLNYTNWEKYYSLIWRNTIH